MAAPTYDKDLQDITLAESTTGWTYLGGPGLGAGVDFAMQGTNCVDKQVSASEKGQVYNYGSGITPGANTHFFVWVFLATPGQAATLQNRGLAIILGTGTSAYVAFHVEGSDTYGAAGRVGRCYPIRYVNTSNGSPPYRTLTGSPGANPQYFGATANIGGSVKSSNLGVDAIRYGTGAYITAGDSGDPATFTGFAATDNAMANRWGILIAAGGTYELQGRFVVGQNNTGTPTAAYFSDSSKVIVVVDTPHSLSDFTQIIVDHASTTFILSSVTFLGLGANNPGRLIFNNASTTGSLTACTFENFGVTTLQAGVTTTDCIWRVCAQITQNGATLSGCSIVRNSAASALLCNNPGVITNCTFESDGTGHAIELTAACAGNTYSLTGNSFSGYATQDGSTGNEVLYNNSGGAVTINRSGGTGAISVRNGAGASTTINDTVTVTLTGLKDNTEVRVYSAGTTTELAGTENATDGSPGQRNFSFGLAASTSVDIKIFNVGYEPVEIYGYSIPGANTSLPQAQRFDRVYENP